MQRKTKDWNIGFGIMVCQKRISRNVSHRLPRVMVLAAILTE